MNHGTLLPHRQTRRHTKRHPHNLTNQRLDPHNPWQINPIQETLDLRNTTPTRNRLNEHEDGSNKRKQGLKKQECQKCRSTKFEIIIGRRRLCILVPISIRLCALIIIALSTRTHSPTPIRTTPLPTLFQQIINNIILPLTQTPTKNITKKRQKSLNHTNQHGEHPPHQTPLFPSRPPLPSIAEMELGDVCAPYFAFVRFVVVGLDVRCGV